MRKKLNNLVLIVLFVIAILPSFRVLLQPGYFPMHDDMQAMRLLQMDKCVKDGQIPCRWVPDMGYGYGYPQFNYYNPLPYYIMEGFHLFGLGFLDSVKEGFLISVLLSALGMFLLGRELWGKEGGILSALFYIYAPYRAVDMYVRGAVGELYAFAVLPFLFWSAKKVVDGNRRAYFWLAASLAALLTSHNVTSLIALPFFVLWLLFVLIIKYEITTPLLLIKKSMPVVFSCFWGFLLSAFFVLPALVEQKYVHIETLTVGYFNYLAHFVSLKQMFFSSYWGYGSSELGPYDDLSLSIGIFHWTIPLLVLLILLLKKKLSQFKFVLYFVLTGFLTLFLIHQKSTYIWENLKTLSLIQFPWRFLALGTFMFSVASGALVTIFSNTKEKLFSMILLIALLLLFNASLFKPRNWISINDSQKFTGEMWDKQQTISIFDYLPIYAEFPPAEKAYEKPQLENADPVVAEGEKGSNWQKWTISLPAENKVVFPLYYFPNWQVKVNGIEVPVEKTGDLGLVTARIPSGVQNVELKLKDTPVRNLANLLTLIGLAIIPLFTFKIKRL